MAESGPPGQSPDDLGDRGSGAPSETAAWLQRWRERLSFDDPGIPQDEARLVIEAVLEDLAGGRPDNLDRAGRAWGRAHRSVSEMVGRLSSFREALAANGVEDPLQMHRAVDRVTAAATEEVLHRLEHASRTDALTGVGNRRAFDETLSAALSAASRQGHDVTVVAVDLDGLKRINDTEGHAAGDSALLSLVRAFYSALRDEDTVFRVGGDEFVVLLPFTSVSAAEMLMERIHASGAPAFTWGAAGYRVDGADAHQLAEAADADLYRRRQQRRSSRPVPAARRARPVLGLERFTPAWRWAWIPAAAVLLVSLVATLLVTGGNSPRVSASRNPSVATRPGHGGTAAPGAPNGATPSAPGPAFPTGVSTFNAGFFAPLVGRGPGGGSTTTTAPPSSTTTTTAPPHTGGVVGLVQQTVAPVPLVGGPNGLAAVIAQVLVGGQPTTTASGGGMQGLLNALVG